jgi:hypothetical protein
MSTLSHSKVIPKSIWNEKEWTTEKLEEKFKGTESQRAMKVCFFFLFLKISSCECGWESQSSCCV